MVRSNGRKDMWWWEGVLRNEGMKERTAACCLRTIPYLAHECIVGYAHPTHSHRHEGTYLELCNDCLLIVGPPDEFGKIPGGLLEVRHRLLALRRHPAKYKMQMDNEYQHRFVAHFLCLYILFFGFRFRFHVRTLRSHHTTPGHRLLHP